jgi:hypothetical protein
MKGYIKIKFYKNGVSQLSITVMSNCIISLKREKVELTFLRFQPTISWPIAFGPVVKAEHHGGRM